MSRSPIHQFDPLTVGAFAQSDVYHPQAIFDDVGNFQLEHTGPGTITGGDFVIVGYLDDETGGFSLYDTRTIGGFDLSNITNGFLILALPLVPRIQCFILSGTTSGGAVVTQVTLQG